LNIYVPEEHALINSCIAWAQKELNTVFIAKTITQPTLREGCGCDSKEDKWVGEFIFNSSDFLLGAVSLLSYRRPISSIQLFKFVNE
jgi:hypothetical protein